MGRRATTGGADHCSTTFLREHPGIVVPQSHASWDRLAGEGSEVNKHFREWLHCAHLPAAFVDIFWRHFVDDFRVTHPEAYDRDNGPALKNN